jgi:hypothetical protein
MTALQTGSGRGGPPRGCRPGLSEQVGGLWSRGLPTAPWPTPGTRRRRPCFEAPPGQRPVAAVPALPATILRALADLTA